MTKNLTSGSPAKLILFFALPYLMVNLFQNIYNIADMLIVGRILGTHALAAVGSTGSLTWFINGTLSSLALGFSMLTAQYFGADNTLCVKKSFSNAITITFFSTILITLLCIIFMNPILDALNTQKEIYDDTYSYIIWIMWGLIPSTAYILLSSMLRALGDSKTPMIFSIISCIVNIALDYVFIKYFNMGTGGAGFATFLAQLLSFILCAVFLIKRFPILHFPASYLIPNRKMIGNLLKIALPVAFLEMVNSSGSLISQYAVNSLGVDCVTAATTGNKINSFMWIPTFAFGSALSMFCAQNYGAKEYDRIKNGVHQTNLMMYGWTVFQIIFITLCGKWLGGTVANTSDGEIINNIHLHTTISSLFSLILVPLINYKAALQSCGRAAMPVFSGFFELCGRTTASLIIAPIYGFIGISFVGPIAWLLGFIPILIDYILFLKKMKKQKAFKNEII